MRKILTVRILRRLGVNLGRESFFCTGFSTRDYTCSKCKHSDCLKSNMLSLNSFPKAILHIDADAFFASCEQVKNSSLRGKPLVVGQERGIATAVSYEAKALGIKRGERIYELRKKFPQLTILPSDYEYYSLVSSRFFNITKRFTPIVEQYSIDECFAELTGLRRPLRKSYEQMAAEIKQTLEKELGLTFSLGLAPTKVLAKIGSSANKPSGLVIIKDREIEQYLKGLPLEKVWGIGKNTAYILSTYCIDTFTFAQKNEQWVRKMLTKPGLEIWQELRGVSVYPVQIGEPKKPLSLQCFRTFYPPVGESSILKARLVKNIEHISARLRSFNLLAKEMIIVLKTEDFNYQSARVVFPHATNDARVMVGEGGKVFDSFSDCSRSKNNHLVKFRATGVVLRNLASNDTYQLHLFADNPIFNEKSHTYTVLTNHHNHSPRSESVLGECGGEVLRRYTNISKITDQLNSRFGSHSVFLASSLEKTSPKPSNLLEENKDFYKHLRIPYMSIN